ncbi:hypothetical protein RvY_09720 [Ramazzottius varieornatus]|uniref:Protein kinase domain-containing protein n=1 Tax=Ramazzottius varieornatus TaxID=947166 RepID=A0A1D1VI58_RAMVA|nr:hypothetical protein RvY_09720 [Ramazzottius varieornatus]
MCALPDPGTMKHFNSPQRMTIAEFRQSLMLTRSLEDFGYVKRDLIAEGGYGKVYKGWDSKYNRHVALKYMDHQVDKGISQATLREVTLLRSAENHENIVKVLDCCLVSDATVLVLEYCETDLSMFIKKYRDFEVIQTVLTCALIKSIMRDILTGADYLHARGISHRDLKPRNILLNSAHRAKIADFGLSKFITFPVRRMAENFGTRWYRAPEILLSWKTTSMRVDMWSIGTIFAELKERVAIFPGRDHQDQIHIVFATLGTPTQESWPEILNHKEFKDLDIPYYPSYRLDVKTPHMTTEERVLLGQFLSYSPCRRPSASEALEFPYFALPQVRGLSHAGGLTNRAPNLTPVYPAKNGNLKQLN